MGPLGGKIAQSYAAGGRRGGLYAAIGQFLANFYREPGAYSKEQLNMSIVEIVLLGVALSMDAFAATISNVFCYPNASRARLLALPVAFGVFQAGMPLLGYFLGGVVGDFIETYSGHHHAGDSWLYRRKYD